MTEGLLPPRMPEENDPPDDWERDVPAPNGGERERDREQGDREVVDNGSLTPDLDSLSTFSEKEGPISYKLIPQVHNSTTVWLIKVYSKGVQGPIYQSDSKITDDSADSMGLTRRLQDRLNSALEYAQKNLRVPPELGDQTRQKRSLHDLEMMIEENGPTNG